MQTPHFCIFVCSAAVCTTLSSQVSSFEHCDNHSTTAVPHQAVPFVTATFLPRFCVCACVCHVSCLPRKPKRTHTGSLKERCLCGGRTLLNTHSLGITKQGAAAGFSTLSTTAAVPIAVQQYHSTRASRPGVRDSHGMISCLCVSSVRHRRRCQVVTSAAASHFHLQLLESSTRRRTDLIIDILHRNASVLPVQVITLFGLQFRFRGNWGQITWNLSGLPPKMGLEF